jgi:predicted  nucleic acid-binding Zn-ribbon protein
MFSPEHSEGSMPSPTIEQLLILQDRDTKRLGIEAQLKAVPREIAAVEQRIAAEKAAIDAAKAEVHGLESKKKILETEIGSAETQRGKYQTQQFSVKKNDEYQALGHQIADMGRQIGELEGKELEAMYGIDEAKKRFVAAESTLKQNIAGHEARIRSMKERDQSLSEELKGAVAAVAEARAPVAEGALQAYDQAARRRMPAVVAIRGGKCGGCHLKVSSEVESAARGKTSEVEFALCDQCSQMVYWES